MTTDIRKDLAGGFVSAAVAVPMAMGFGMFALVSLGDQYFVDGARAGLITACVVGAVSLLLGDRLPTVYAPRVISTFFLGTVLYGLVHSQSAEIKSGGITLVIGAFFAIVMLGGVFQFLIGFLRLGTLIRYAPHPVVAGFQNAAAILLFLVQTGNVLGFEHSIPFTQALHHLDQAKPASILIALGTFVVTWYAKRLVPRVPPVLLGLAAGTALYYALVAAQFSLFLGPVISGGVTVSGLASAVPDFQPLVALPPSHPLWLTIVLSALALSIIVSFDALLCAKLIARPGDGRLNSDRLLMRLGVGNALTSIGGGITSGINIGPTLTNRAFGGGGRLSVLVNIFCVVLSLTVLFPLLVQLPRAVLSAVIMVVAVQHLDAWTLRSLRQWLAGSPAYRRLVSLDLAVALLVAALAVTIDIVLAVFCGVALSVVLFVVRMSRSAVRRTYRADVVRSRKSRPSGAETVLDRHGGEILVIELQGALFFGSAENLSIQVDEIIPTIRCLVLDLRRVTEIDSTGAQVLNEIRNELALKKKSLFLSSAGSAAAEWLKEFVGTSAAGSRTIFQDVDRAIEAAEDLVLKEWGGNVELDHDLQHISLFRDFGPQDLAAFAERLHQRHWSAGEPVFREGEPGDELFIVASGTAGAYLAQGDGNIRLATFGSGTVFGEFALLDRGVRSASVIADGDLSCYVLHRRDFSALSEQAPAVAIKLLTGLGGELSARLRRANRAIHELSS